MNLAKGAIICRLFWRYICSFDRPTISSSCPRLCNSTDIAAVERVLRKSGFDEDGYVVALERHADLVRALGLPEFGVGTAYASFESDELSEGLKRKDVVRTDPK